MHESSSKCGNIIPLSMGKNLQKWQKRWAPGFYRVKKSKFLYPITMPKVNFALHLPLTILLLYLLIPIDAGHHL